jgi:hypothetical protein
MTYRSLARRAYDVARAHVNPALPKAKAFAADFAIRTAQVACIMAIGAAFGIQFGADRADARHLGTLRRVVPVLEAAVAAHEHELAALADTLGALPERAVARAVEGGSDE